MIGGIFSLSLRILAQELGSRIETIVLKTIGANFIWLNRLLQTPRLYYNRATRHQLYLNTCWHVLLCCLLDQVHSFEYAVPDTGARGAIWLGPHDSLRLIEAPTSVWRSAESSDIVQQVKPYIFLWLWLIHYSAFSAAKALDRNPGPGYNTLLLRLIPGDPLSACPHRQFHTLPGLLDSRAALSNSYPKASVQCREAVCTIFMMVFGMTRPGREPATYHMRGGHPNHSAIPTR